MNKLTLSERLRRNRRLKPFLQELSELTGDLCRETDLLDPELANDLRSQLIAMPGVRRLVCDIPFEEKASEKFSRYINNLDEKSRCGIYIWPEPRCGLGPLLVSSLSSIDLNFDFWVNDGIICLSSENLENSLTLNFYEDRGELRLEVKVIGGSWLDIDY